MQYEDFHKRLLALDRELWALHNHQRNLGWVELNPPVMRGYKRSFVLREDVARSRQASFFEGILQKINTTHYSYRKDFKVKKRKLGKKCYVVKEQGLHAPNEWQLKRLKFTPKELEFFDEKICRDKFGKEDSKRYFFNDQWRFVLKVKPNIITRTQLRDEAAEKRTEEIDQLLRQQRWENTLWKLKYGAVRRWYGESDLRKPAPLTKPLLRLLDELKEEQPDGYYSQSIVSNEQLI